MKKITKFNLVKYFSENNTDLLQKMIDTTHYVNLDEPNIYHAEGNIWTHTMCVLTTINFLTSDIEQRKILYFVALLHDIGKTKTQVYKEANDEKPVRYSFPSHESNSFFMAIDILRDFQEVFDITDQDIKDILTVIGLHGSAIIDTEHPLTSNKIQELRKIFRKADKNGAVRIQEVEGDYNPRKILERKPDENKEVLFMIGLPCSGKSTYISKLEDYHIVSRDKALEDFYVLNFGAFSNTHTDYNEIFRYIHEDKELLSKFNNYFENTIREASTYNRVVIDMTMLGLRSRRKMLSKFPKHKANCKVFITELSDIEERNINRKGKFISETVFDMMKSGFTFPTHFEFDEIELVQG